MSEPIFDIDPVKGFRLQERADGKESDTKDLVFDVDKLMTLLAPGYLTPEERAIRIPPEAKLVNHSGGKVQCKHIDEEPILRLMYDNPKVWFHAYEPSVAGIKSIQLAFPRGLDYRLVLAKMRSLIDRNLVEGCSCGCYGGFYLTEKGKQYFQVKYQKEQP